jgi:shikimate dehydrogenase
MITGKTRFIAHLGVPTGSFRSPMIYNPWFEKSGIDCVVVPMGCEAEDFPAFLPMLFRLRNIAGALVTMPHKVTAARLLDVASPAVRICGACNAVRRDGEGRLVGDMFDGEGFVRGMERKGRKPAGSSALVIGAGGAGSAIAASLAAAGVARLGIHDCEMRRAERLRDSIVRHCPGVEAVACGNDPSGWQIVVNATPLGMQEGDALPADMSRIDAGAFVADVVMAREITPFLEAARQRGCLIQVGVDMLYEQIPAYLEFFGFPAASADELRAVSKLQY